MMYKYEKWNFIKIKINSKRARPIFSVRDIWFCYVGANIGDEQDGTVDENFIRPVLVVHKFNENICWIIPLTRNPKKSKYYFELHIFEIGYSAAILSQLRLIDVSRLTRKIGFVPKDVFAKIQENLKRFLC